MAGESFAPYVVKARLRALGLHVNCYRAAEPGLEREVELRVLHLTGGAGPEEAERFTREYRALASFDHPNLVQVLDIGKTSEHLFYATYYRESQSVEDLLQKGRLPELAVARAACAVAAGLHYLHGHGYLHRSLAATAIFHDSVLDRFYLGDYSTMAAAEAGNGPDAPGSARLSMTPEARYRQPFDPRTDLFLLGSTLYRMLTGMDPLPSFAQLDASSGSLTQPAIGHAPDICREMDGFLLKALEPDPANRFQDAAEMLAAAEHVVKKLELKSLVERTSSSGTIPILRDPSGLSSGITPLPNLAGARPLSPGDSSQRLSRAQRSPPLPPGARPPSGPAANPRRSVSHRPPPTTHRRTGWPPASRSRARPDSDRPPGGPGPRGRSRHSPGMRSVTPPGPSRSSRSATAGRRG
jgi:serine/threonine protein kinase